MKTFNDYLTEAAPLPNKLPNGMLAPPPVPQTNKKVMRMEDLMKAISASSYMPQSFFDSNGIPHSGSFRSLQVEDGSGKSFIVVIITQDGQQEKFHVRTV